MKSVTKAIIADLKEVFLEVENSKNYGEALMKIDNLISEAKASRRLILKENQKK